MLLGRVAARQLVPLATPALFLEYEAVLKRPDQRIASPNPRGIPEENVVTDSTVSVRLPHSVAVAAERLAREDGVSLDQWITSAIAQKVGAAETEAEFFRRRAGAARAEDLQAKLMMVPDRAPDPGDEVPVGL